MNKSPLWIVGKSRCGKTTRLVEEYSLWVSSSQPSLASKTTKRYSLPSLIQPKALVFTANGENRRQLNELILTKLKGNYPVEVKTLVGFIQDEVNLFYPLIAEKLNLKPQISLRLRPETEQELATKLWRSELNQQDLLLFGGEYRFIRNCLDLLQLAGAAGIRPEHIPHILQGGLGNNFILEPQQQDIWIRIGKLLLQWRQWCLERGLLTYGLIFELYWRYLLPDHFYQHHLINRYQGIFADDVDDYPAISRDLLVFWLENQCFGVFTYNQDGQVRLGLNADPHCLETLASYCQIETIDSSEFNHLGSQLGKQVSQLISEPFAGKTIPPQIETIKTLSRAELLRATTEFIINAIQNEGIKPQDIAIIAPGLDDIGRYTIIDILEHQGIAVEPLNEQRPLISSSLIRAILTLLGLVYQGLGRLVETDAVAEMLVVLSQNYGKKANDQLKNDFKGDIDPVRAGLLADYCYHFDLELPRLAPVETFKRWDRLGYRAVQAYNYICQWIEKIKAEYLQQAVVSPIIIIDCAIKEFFGEGSQLDYTYLSNLRELRETAQHFWEVEARLAENETISSQPTEAIAEFIKLLRRGTISANPYPVKIFDLSQKQDAVMLANVFQYRSLRHHHRWQFWLDTGSHLWGKRGASELFAAPLFLREYREETRSLTEIQSEEALLQRIIADLLARATEKVYLCHSELGINGAEETGPLSILVHACH
jgi:hypothetical protein